MKYKAQIETLLYDLKTAKHSILPKYANTLATQLEQYLDMPEDMPEEVMPISGSVEETLDNGVAVIVIDGIIVKRTGLPQEFLDFFGLVDLDNVNDELKQASGDPNVTAIVLYVTSPGGYLSGVQSTANLIDEITKQKEVVVYSDVLNASAAYWISSQASSIIASYDAELGSIGVYTQIYDFSKALENQGIKVHLIKAGKWKDVGDQTQALTDEQKTFVQSDINATWETFKTAVTTKRNIAVENMEGQTFSGEQLLNNGFVDGYASDIETVIVELLKV